MGPMSWVRPSISTREANRLPRYCGMDYSQNIQRLRPSATIAVSSLAKRLAAEGRDIINLSAGEPDFDTPSFASDRGIAAIREGQTRYTPAAGMPALRQAVADYMTRGTQHPSDPTRVVVTAGAKQALFNACFCLFGPGDEVLIGAPYWTSYPEIVGLAQADPVFVGGDEEKGFLLRPADLEGARTPVTKGLIISSPSNPSGATYSIEELGAIVDWAKEHNIVVISDEIYREIFFGDGDRAPSVLDLDPSRLGPVVVINGMSKSMAMTGWRIGFSFSNKGLAGKMTALQSHVSSNAATPSQFAALEGLTRLDETAAVQRTMVAAFRKRRKLVEALFDELLPNCPYVAADGAFYLYFRIDSRFDDTCKGSADVCTLILEETGVAIVPGVAFGDDRYARMSTASSEDALEDGVRRMAKVLAPSLGVAEAFQ